MRLRAIRLTNVRRFAGQTAVIDGLGDGLSVIAAPNESGKSTIFDALHALFFAPHGSRARDVASLQPHAGGRVEISADIDLPEGLFRLDKAFLLRPGARVTDLASGRIIAQDDAAEAWIQRLTAQALRGPAGLLWVRQGTTTLDPATTAERDRLLATRRDLLSSVAGEIDLMTGGRRMDRVRDACEADLARLVTATKRPRKGGPWADVRDEIESLDAEIATLTTQSRALAEALARRRDIARRLAQLDAPDARAARASALAAADQALQAAEAHAARLATAGREVEVARLTAEEAARRHKALLDAMTPLPRLAAARTAAAATAADLAARMAAARMTEDTARAAHTTAAARLTTTRAASDLARRAAAARLADKRRQTLAAALAAAERQARAVTEAEARIASLPVTDKAIAALDLALGDLATARAAAAARAVTLTLTYDGAARVARDGAPLPPGETALTARTTLALPGIGHLAIDPGAAAADPAALASAEAAVTRALGLCAALTPEAAREALRRKAEAVSARHLAAELLKTHAPDGLSALRAALAQAESEAALAPVPGGETGPDRVEDGSAPPPFDPAAALDLAEQAESRARAALDTAIAAAAALTVPLAEARAAVSLAQTRLAEAEAEAGDPATREARAAALASDAATSAAALAVAAAARDAAARAAPDLATARAERARAHSADAAAAREAATLREEQARLAGVIQTQADLAVDERLAAAQDARAAAAAREVRLAAEVAALQRLAEVLDTTRMAAREAYFGPVQRELAPLLAILAEDAALSFDADSLLPDSLARAGGNEPLGTLSGGTQEQIAILTRLAFARLFARAGAPVPVILDDALVHTDDTRIMRMFTALHRVAADQQVIVFTCRTLAFEALGGTRPALTVSGAT